LINRHIHAKVDRATSLCGLLYSIRDYIKNEEYLEKFDVKQNALSKIGMLMLNTRFFSQIDVAIKSFLKPVILEKQRLQMNQSVCYNINQITEWQCLIEVSIIIA